MCGIVGLFLKDPSLEPDLGKMLSDMLITMSDRGPDSAGIAIYGQETQNRAKLTLQSEMPARDFTTLAKDLGAELALDVTLAVNDTHAVLELDENISQPEIRVHHIKGKNIVDVFLKVGSSQNLENSRALVANVKTKLEKAPQIDQARVFLDLTL